MTSSPTLLSIMAETIQGVDAIDGVLIEPCTPVQREAILRAIEPVVLTNPMAWQKYFAISVAAPDGDPTAIAAETTAELTAQMDAFRDTAGPLPIVFVPDAESLAAIPPTLRARLRHVPPRDAV